MNWDSIQPGLSSDESYRRICEALRVEKDKRWGEIAEIEADIDVSNGYLAKVCRGEWKISFERLLLTLERMGIDPGRFFVKALDVRLENDWLLEEIERSGEIDGRLARIEKVTADLEAPAAIGPAAKPVDAEAMVADFVQCKGKEQRRRLGRAQKYRHPAFAAAYLEHLDTLRYDDVKEARQNAEAVAVKLIPRLPGAHSERVALQLKAIGVYASCHRQKGNWATAARALRLALGLARRQRAQEMLADLLMRAACVLGDSGRLREAMVLLDETLVIYVDADSREELGMVMVERGRTLLYLGEHREAVSALDRSLSLLRGDTRRVRDWQRINRNRLAAHQLLALAYHEMDDLERAEDALAQAVVESAEAGRVIRATILWQHGVIALKRSFYNVAEERLRDAARLFARLQDPNKAMVALDLAKSLLSQGKTLEAVVIAMDMAEFLTIFRGNSVAEALISDLIQTAVRGNLTVGAIDKVQKKLLAT